MELLKSIILAWNILGPRIKVFAGLYPEDMQEVVLTLIKQDGEDMRLLALMALSIIRPYYTIGESATKLNKYIESNWSFCDSIYDSKARSHYDFDQENLRKSLVDHIRSEFRLLNVKKRSNGSTLYIFTTSILISAMMFGFQEVISTIILSLIGFALSFFFSYIFGDRIDQEVRRLMYRLKYDHRLNKGNCSEIILCDEEIETRSEGENSLEILRLADEVNRCVIQNRESNAPLPDNLGATIDRLVKLLDYGGEKNATVFAPIKEDALALKDILKLHTKESKKKLHKRK
jgi:hypothetical protein